MPSAVALVLAMTFSAERSVQIAAGGRVEALGGVMPDGPLRPSRPQLAFTVVPVAGLHVQRQRYELTALYRPRAFWRFPNQLNMTRPLILHQGSLEHRYDWTSRTTTEIRFQLSAGEVDYALSSLVFDPMQPTVPTDRVTELIRGQLRSRLAYELSHRWSTGVGLEGSYSAPLDREQAPGFLTSGHVELDPFLGYRWDGRSEVTVLFGVGTSWFDTGSRERTLWGNSEADSGVATYLILSPRLRFSHLLSRQTDVMIGAGVSQLEVTQGSELLGAPEGERRATPTAEVEVRSRVWQKRGTALSVGAAGAHRWFFDPILGRPVRRIGGGVSSELELPPDWTVRANVSFFTTLGTDEFGSPQFALPDRFDQTMLRFELPINYNLSRYIGVEFGVRSNLRGPAIEDGLVLNRPEFWAYGALRFVFDPRDSEAGWAR